MTDHFAKILHLTMLNEDSTYETEGFKLHKVADDSGGLTYAGITKNNFPRWRGWGYIEKGDMEQADKLIAPFYKLNFYDKVRGDELNTFGKAFNLFDFAINTGTRRTIKMAQRAVGCTADGKIGPITVKAINEMPNDEFCSGYYIAKTTRYATICNRKRSQKKFLHGWINRSLTVLELTV